MKKNAHARRIEHRAKLRQAAAGQLSQEEAAAVQAAEKTRVAAIKPVVALTRKQRKAERAKRRAGN